jgi:LmbE family N-acetylglucosaminyl deacetylase
VSAANGGDLIVSAESIAVIVAHPDDEVLAFGGTMARHAAEGSSVHVLIMATGLASRTPDGSVTNADIERLQVEALAANKLLGAKVVEFADFPDNRMDSVALLDVVKRTEQFLDKFRTTTVYTHHHGDMNIDHGIVARAVLTASRMLPGSRIRRIYAGEVLSSSEYTFPEWRFAPTSYVNIAAFVAQKCKAMEAYAGEIRAWPHPRSVEGIKALASLRGAEAGLEAAEALRVMREVW